MNKLFFTILCLLLSQFSSWTQLVTVNTEVAVFNGALIVINDGSLQVQAQGDLSNDGILIVDGDIENIGTLSSGAIDSGFFLLKGNWINDNLFNPGRSNVVFEGDDQLISGGKFTQFHQLELSGTGLKEMTIDARANYLALNDRELFTNANTFLLSNANPNAITRNSGFISNSIGGKLERITDTTLTYIFPLGSNLNTFRYRPLEITPSESTTERYGAAMLNYSPDVEGLSTVTRGEGIEEVNELFFHQVFRKSTIPANVKINYESSLDGDWKDICEWRSSIWVDYPQTTRVTGGTMDKLSNDLISFGFENLTLCDVAKPYYVPNSFSPNFDNLNDKFGVEMTTRELDYFELSIFNRWGELVFNTIDHTEFWDGTYKEELVSDGIYVWTLQYRATGQVTIENSRGTVNIIK